MLRFLFHGGDQRMLRFYCTGMRGGSTMYRIAEQTAVSRDRADATPTQCRQIRHFILWLR